VKGFQIKASKLLARAKICRWCLGRQFTTDLRNAEALGASLGSNELASCDICGGAYAKRLETVETVLEKLTGYEFASFQVGVIVPKNKVDREDELRSQCRISTGIGLKKALVAMYRSELRAKVPHVQHKGIPDISVKIDLENGKTTIETRSLLFFVRYVKLDRGILVRGKPCNVCCGFGCAACSDVGLEAEPKSIEFFIVKQFKESFNGSKVKISWSGTDDENSLVNGSGRPIFVQVYNPIHRFSGVDKLDRMVGGPIQLVLIEERMASAVAFTGLKKLVKFYIKLSSPWVHQIHEIENQFKNKTLPSASRSTKRIYWLKIEIVDNLTVVVLAYMDNGISPWSLLNGVHTPSKEVIGLIDVIGPNVVTSCTYDVIDFKFD